jgi:hypothetical protein
LTLEFNDMANAIMVAAGDHQAPEYKFPAAPNDAWAAHTWTLVHAKEINGDPARVAAAAAKAPAATWRHRAVRRRCVEKSFRRQAVSLAACGNRGSPVRDHGILYKIADLESYPQNLWVTPPAPSSACQYGRPIYRLA